MISKCLLLAIDGCNLNEIDIETQFISTSESAREWSDSTWMTFTTGLKDNEHKWTEENDSLSVEHLTVFERLKLPHCNRYQSEQNLYSIGSWQGIKAVCRGCDVNITSGDEDTWRSLLSILDAADCPDVIFCYVDPGSFARVYGYTSSVYHNIMNDMCKNITLLHDKLRQREQEKSEDWMLIACVDQGSMVETDRVVIVASEPVDLLNANKCIIEHMRNREM